MAERSAWRFFGRRPSEGPTLTQLMKRALAQRLRAWADEVLHQTEGVVTASTPGAPQPAPSSAPAASIDDDDDRPPAEWLEYVRQRAPHLVAGGRFRPSQHGGPSPRLSQPEPAPRAPTDRGPTMGGRAPVGGPPAAAAAASSARGVWPRGRRLTVAADATKAAGNRADSAPPPAEAPAIADTAWPRRTRRSDHGVPSIGLPEARQTSAAPAPARSAPPPPPPPPPAAAAPPRARAAGEPPVRALGRLARRATEEVTAAVPPSERDDGTGSVSRPSRAWAWPPAPALEPRPAAPTPAPARLERRHDIAPPAAPAAGAPPDSSSAPRDLWPKLPSLAPSDPDDLARDLEARERRARLRREQVGAP